MLIFRLSSLGDVVLATAALEAKPPAPEAGKESRIRLFDWVVAQEFAPLLEEHPRIHRLWKFNRKEGGLKSWLEFCEELWMQEYTEVLDLHSSLRTKIAKILFRWFAWRDGRAFPTWKTFSKSRWRLMGLFVFKALWPKSLHPISYRQRFGVLAGGTGREAPDFKWQLNKKRLLSWEQFVQKKISSKAGREAFQAGRYLCVMPGSAWAGKRLPIKRYVGALKGLGIIPVILGGIGDQESLQLVDLLEKEKMEFVSGVGQWTLSEVAQVLGHSRGYLGNDTGLAHLAEAVGVPALVVFGPTIPEMGFAPWRSESKSIGADLWCRPCSKDGRGCFRPVNRYLCLQQVKETDIQVVVRKVIHDESKI